MLATRKSDPLAFKLAIFGPEVAFASPKPSTSSTALTYQVDGNTETDLPVDEDLTNDAAKFDWATSRENRYVELSGNTLFLGPVDPLHFLHRHFPDAGEIPEVEDLTMLYEAADAKDRYDLARMLVKALQSFCPGMILKETANDGHEHSNTPDVTLFNTQNSSRSESHFVIGFDPEDAPFNDHDYLFARETFRAAVMQGQMIMHAANHLAIQHRTHFFTVFIRREWARFIRWDQAGALVTHAFQYDTEDGARLLAKFLWMFSHAGDAIRGYDETVMIPGPEDEEVVARARQELGVRGEDALWKFAVYDDTRLDEVSYYFGGDPLFQSQCRIGRNARVTRVWDPLNERLAILKDVWREDIHDLATQKEGDVYRKLHAVGVRNILPLYASGDFPLACHRTRLDEIIKLSGFRTHFPQRRHHRLVIGDVGGRNQLLDCRDTRELVRAMRDALQAHSDAYKKAGILHCDISNGNILISDDGQGFLIDWENARIVNQDGVVPNLTQLLGTPAYTSARLLHISEGVSSTDPDSPSSFSHKVSDDLESFYHVLSWVTLKRHKHSIPIKRLEWHLRAWFEGNPFRWSRKPGYLSSHFMSQHAGLPCTALRTLFETLDSVFGTRYGSLYGFGVNEDDEGENIEIEKKKAELESKWERCYKLAQLEASAPGDASSRVTEMLRRNLERIEEEIACLEEKLKVQSSLCSEWILECFEEAIRLEDWPEADIQCVDHEGEWYAMNRAGRNDVSDENEYKERQVGDGVDEEVVENEGGEGEDEDE